MSSYQFMNTLGSYSNAGAATPGGQGAAPGDYYAPQSYNSFMTTYSNYLSQNGTADQQSQQGQSHHQAPGGQPPNHHLTGPQLNNSHQLNPHAVAQQQLYGDCKFPTSRTPVNSHTGNMQPNRTPTPNSCKFSLNGGNLNQHNLMNNLSHNSLHNTNLNGLNHNLGKCLVQVTCEGNAKFGLPCLRFGL